MTKENHDIATAIRRVTEHARKYADITVWDIDQRPTEDEIATRRKAIEAVCNEMDEFASRASLEDVRFPEFNQLCKKLQYFPAMPPYYFTAIALAFHAAGRLDDK